MKLLNKTQRLFLQLALPVFILAGLGMYWALRFVADDFTDENLQQVKAEIETYVRNQDTLPVFFQTANNRITIDPFDGPPVPERYSDTLLLNALEVELEPYRRLEFPLQFHGQNYRVSIQQSQLEHEDLALTVSLLLLLLGALLLALLLWVNHRVAHQVWQPFFNTLDRMRNFKLNEQTPLNLDKTEITEFKELHSTLENLVEKVRRDFQTVKQFTENASHEMQTPLAVIQNQVELLLQNEALTEPQAEQLVGIEQALRRMIRLHQALLLLAKIGNNQFPERSRVDLKVLLEKKLTGLEELLLEKKLELQTDFQSAYLEINPMLAETLITNLLANAMKHNLNSGNISIRLAPGELHIENSCSKPSRSVPELQTRFVRGNGGAEGLGLGLAIVQEICDISRLQFSSSYEEGIWRATLEWPVI